MLTLLRRMGQKLPSWIAIFMSCVFLYILGILVIGESAFSFAYDNRVPFSNGVLMLTALLLMVGGLAGFRLLRKLGLPRWRSGRPLLWLCLGHGLLFLVQLVYVHSLWFYAGWDVVNCYEAALELARDLPLTNSEYFQLCPNNAPLALTLSIPMWIGDRLGLAVPYLMLPVGSAALVNLASLFTVLCAYRLTKSWRATCFCWAFSTVFILLSPYLSMPYTDAYSILFPVLTLYTYLSGLRRPLKWFLVGLFASMGGAMKITALIFLIALLLVKGLGALAALPWVYKRVRGMAAAALALLLGLAPGIAYENTACLILAGSTIPEGQLGLTHYLMLGVNPDTYGGHSPEDVAFSLSYPTLAERNQANMEAFADRLTAMSPAKGIRFFTTKLYKAYNSGTFEWNGSHLQLEVPKRDDPVSLLLRSVYYGKGQYNWIFISIYQCLWLMILLLCACGLFLTGRRYPNLPLLGLTLLGVTLYLLLFEVWPRYLFLYAPFFVILATMGARALGLVGCQAPRRKGIR